MVSDRNNTDTCDIFNYIIFLNYQCHVHASKTPTTLHLMDSDYEKLWAYVSNFVPYTCLDEHGNVLYDSEGNPFIKDRFINTKDLVKSSDPRGLLGNL